MHKAFGIIKPIHAQAEQRKRQGRLRAQAHNLACDATSTGQIRPPSIVNAHGEWSYPRVAPRIRHHTGFVVDAGAQHALRTREAIVTVLREVEPEEVVPQQALQQFPPPGTGPVQLPGWPGDVPEVHDGEVRETLAEQGWTER